MERDKEDEKKTPFVMLTHGENERGISPRANKKRLFLFASPYDFTPVRLDFYNCVKFLASSLSVCKYCPISYDEKYLQKTFNQPS